ncbi:MAG: DUF2293 domain-containing protein [Actinomycetota bacterium]
MAKESPAKFARRVTAAADAALAQRKFVAPVDVLTGLGWIHSTHIDAWRQGRVTPLEDRLPAGRLAEVVEILRRWAEARGLTAAEASYLAATRDRRELRFSASGDAATERACRTHWMSPGLTAARQEQITERHSRPPDLVVIIATKDWSCVSCGDTSEYLIMEDSAPHCLRCADLDHLVFLASGDAALTRRARKASALSAVVIGWSRSRRRYERQGILVSEQALQQAEQECLADEDARLRRRERDRERRADQDVVFQARMAAEVARLFPGCPASRATAIAEHAGLRGSGRVGRSAAGRALDPEAVTRAVIASVRHEDTPYDALLMAGTPRMDARGEVRPVIDRVLAAWRSGPDPGPGTAS